MCPRDKAGEPTNRRPLEKRWNFLEAESEACAVFSRRMEILYLNGAARPLVPPQWWGRRCWEMFPVGEASCASRCPAVRAVSAAEEIVYCEEALYPGGDLQTFGVTVIPLDSVDAGDEQALILLLPKSSASDDNLFRVECLTKARELRTRVDEELHDGLPNTSNG